MRAIDLYSGVGGWSLGLSIAGIEVVASYEWWRPAVSTKERNGESGWYSKTVETTDIRELPLDQLPSGIDIVVGSPPCTQFSYANKGGNGDIEDGIRDIEKFLEIVESVKPRFWVMENVPRVRSLLTYHLYEAKGKLQRFAELFDRQGATIEVVDMSTFGLPQRRKRCLAGHFPFEELNSYTTRCSIRTLGDVVEALRGKEVRDPIYGFEVDRSNLYDHAKESPLSAEEIRLNRDNKRFHPVYNDMAFPDSMERPVRSITATCTRVSRESVIIREPGRKGDLRRLTLRERASLQGFPISFQFHGNSYGAKMKLIGNAMPPLMAYYLGCAFKGVRADTIKHPDEVLSIPSQPITKPPETRIEKAGQKFPRNRSFRAAIPYLRFKSGVRFEFSNTFDEEEVRWRVRFLYGTPKNILELHLSLDLLAQIRQADLFSLIEDAVEVSLTRMSGLVSDVTPDSLQAAWSHRNNGIGPHSLVDSFGESAKELASTVNTLPQEQVLELVEDIIEERTVSVSDNPDPESGRRLEKVFQNAGWVLSGCILGAVVNNLLSKDLYEVPLQANTPFPNRPSTLIPACEVPTRVPAGA